MNEKVQKLLVPQSVTLGEAIRCIDTGTEGIVLVVDGTGQLVGTVTDGDVRRAIMKNVALEDNVSRVMNAAPVTAHAGATKKYLENLMRSKGIRQIPVVDDDLRPIDIVLMKDLFSAQTVAPAAVIMAGGLGTRLREVTRDAIPKPLVKVAGTPVLEKIVRLLASQGVDTVYISVNHKKEQIEEYFGDGRDFGVDIHYMEEKMRLGTAGALGHLRDRMRGPFVVMNADLVCDVNFRNLLDFHAQSGFRMTVCSRKYSMEVPFGVLRVEEARVSGIEEKPRREFFVNAGIYVLEPEVLALVPDHAYLDMTDLITMLVLRGQGVGTFPILNYWIDIGKAEDFERANRELQSNMECAVP